MTPIEVMLKISKKSIYLKLKKIFHMYLIHMYLFISSKSKVDSNKINRQSASQPRFASTLFHFHPFAFARVLSQSTSLTSTHPST